MQALLILNNTATVAIILQILITLVLTQSDFYLSNGYAIVVTLLIVPITYVGSILLWQHQLSSCTCAFI